MAEDPVDRAFELLFARPGAPKASVVLANGFPQVRFADESGLRSALGVLAGAYGWLVQEETVVPGWGRIDLTLRDDPSSAPHLVELKVDLLKPAQVRRAFQQADGYGRWWAAEHGEACSSYLVAASHDRVAVERVERAYPEVRFLPVAGFMAWLSTAGNSARRAMRASHRRSQLRDLLAVHEYASIEVERISCALVVEVVSP